jgi:tetratricopeptide (TPR) repeat protein
LNNKKRAIEGFRILYEKLPTTDSEVVIQLATLYYETDQKHKAIEILKETISKNIDHADFTMLNMLSELYINKKHYTDTIAIIEQVSNTMHIPIELMPIDIKVKYGICLAYQGQLEIAEQKVLTDIIQNKDPIQFRDIFFDVAEILLFGQKWENVSNI